MVCQKCQAAEATVHTTTIVNGNSTEGHFCAKCSKDHTAMPADFQELFQKMLGPLLNIPNMPNMSIQPSNERILSRACPHCGITLHKILTTGQFGCPHDYSVFSDTLSQVIAVAQNGCTKHIGKVPKGVPAETCRTVLQARVDSLQRRLNGAVFREDYEQAAKYRDEIKETQLELQTGDPEGSA